MEPGIYIVLAIIVLLIIIVISNIKIVPQAYVFVVERLGAFHAAWGTGLHVKVPFIDRVAKRVSIKEQVVDFKPQSVITKDNVTMQIDTVVFFQITNAMQFTYGVERPISAIENLTATTLRNIVGDLDLEATLTSRDIINTRITAILDEATDRWGIKVQRVELKNILPPREIQDAMEKQMKADRERREKVIQAEYHLNRNFMFAGVIPLNDFYEFLGLEKTELGDAVGWSSCNGDIYWIDFNHHRLTLDDGMEIYVIDMVFEPTAEWMEDL